MADDLQMDIHMNEAMYHSIADELLVLSLQRDAAIQRAETAEAALIALRTLCADEGIEFRNFIAQLRALVAQWNLGGYTDYTEPAAELEELLNKSNNA